MLRVRAGMSSKRRLRPACSPKPFRRARPKSSWSEVYTSEIQPYKENDITPAASGVHIDRILVDVGSKVREGQLLLTLDPTQYNQQMVQLRTLEDDYNRLLPVYEAGGISTQQIEQAKATLDVQREVVGNLMKNIEVRSPLTGVVTARNNEPGDLFTNTPILARSCRSIRSR